MKTALLICGHMRTFEKTFDSLNRNIIDPLHPDIFIATWDRAGTWAPDISGNGRSYEYHGTVQLGSDEIDVARICSLYHPAQLIVCQYDEWKTAFENMARPVYKWRDSLPQLYHQYRINSYISQYFIRWQGLNALNSSGTTYDTIILTRPDVSPERIPDALNLEAVHIPPSSELTNGWMQEILFLTNHKNMSILCSVFPNYNSIFEEARQLNIPHFFFEPHNLLYNLLVTKNNIQIIDNFPGIIVR